MTPRATRATLPLSVAGVRWGDAARPGVPVESLLTSVLLPAAVGIVMLGLGLSLTTADFTRAATPAGGAPAG